MTILKTFRRKDMWVERWTLLFAAYLFVLLFVARFEEYTFFVNRVLSPTVAALILIRFRFRARTMPKEVVMFGLFLTWTVTGFTMAWSRGLFLRYFRLIFQIEILLVLLALVLVRGGKVQALWAAVAATALGTLAYSFVTGDISLAAGRDVFQVSQSVVPGREGGLAQNANAFGYWMLLGAMALSTFWARRRSAIARALILVLLAFLGGGVVFSASRKAFLSLLFFLALWALVHYGKRILRRPIAVFGLAAVVSVLWQGTSFIVGHSYLGRRLQMVGNSAAGNVGDRNRVLMYRDGIRMAFGYPLSGVGLGNFPLHSVTMAYAHSDLMEVLATTGFPGFFLYVSFYVILWRRIRRLRRLIRAPAVRYELGLYEVFLISHLLIGLGRPHFIQLFSMTFIGLIVGRTSAVERRVRALAPGRIVGGLAGATKNPVHSGARSPAMTEQYGAE